MKTLHLTNSWHAASGGISTFYLAVLEEANRTGHEMRLVVPGDATSTEEVGAFGRIYYIEAPRAPFNPSYRVIYPQRYLLPGTALQRILNDERPDLVEVSEKYTMPYFAGLLRTGRLPGVRFRPTVVGLSCERMDENLAAYLTQSKRGREFCAWYMKWVYFPMFDHHVTVSPHVAGELVEASKGHKVRRGIWTAPMGVDCERFTPVLRSEAGREELRLKLGAPAGATLLLYAGRLAREKNLQLLVETMARLPAAEYWLAVAGEGQCRAQLQEEFGERGISNVTFLGHVGDKSLLASYYANADIFLHPNPREPFGIAPLEAMASGLALVAPNSGGVTEYANGQNAWLMPATGEAFAAAVQSIREQCADTRERRKQARLTAEKFRWAAAAARYLQLYREIHEITTGRRSVENSTAIWSTAGNAFGRETKSNEIVVSL